MARAFSERDRARIDASLRSAATDRFRSGGSRKTTVDELALGAGISKGAFYLFYPSKEALFYRVLMDYHDEVRATLLKRIDALVAEGSPAASLNPATFPAIIADALVETFRAVEASFLPGALANGEMEYLASRLDEETLAAHRGEDADLVSAVLSKVPGLSSSDIPFWGATLRAIFTLTLHRREIGDEYFDRVLESMVRQTVAAMTGDRGGSV